MQFRGRRGRTGRLHLNVDELTERRRAVWAAGDYPDVARTIESVSAVVVAEVGAAAGERVLAPRYLLTVALR